MQAQTSQQTPSEPVDKDAKPHISTSPTNRNTKNQSSTRQVIPQTKAHGHGFLILFLLLLTVTIIGTAAYLWYEQQNLRVHLDNEISLLKKELRGLDNHPAFNELRNRFSEQNNKFAAETQNIQAHITRLNASFETLSNSIAQVTDITHRGQRDWMLAEADYLLSIASMRLQLMQDKQTATQALLAADQRLHSLNDSRLLALRKKISIAITQLQSAPTPDIDGAILRLMELGQLIANLPPATSTPLDSDSDSAQPDDQPDFDSAPAAGWWVNIQAYIKNMLGIHPDKKAFDHFAKQKNLYYLDQLLRIELEAARQALLRYDSHDYENRLSRVKSLLEKHYDPEHERLIQVRKHVMELQQTVVFVELPDIRAVIDELHQTLQRLAQTKTEQRNH